MEWLYLLGSVASIISVLAVLLGLARRRESSTARSFKMLFTLMVSLGLTGLGVLMMALGADSSVMQYSGAVVAITGSSTLAILAVMVVRSSQ